MTPKGPRMRRKQTTITRPVSCYGIGVHSGQKTQLTLKPAPENTGILFIRSDVSSVTNVLQAHYTTVTDTILSTTISNDAKVKISTIEHLMAALYGCGIDNILVEIDGPEVPIMDGSSKPFVFLIECAGVRTLNAPAKILRVLRDIEVSHKDSSINLSPANEFSIDVKIDFASSAIGKQSMGISDISMFKDEIAAARTFGFMHELEYLKNKGLARGASLENAIGIDGDVVLNEGGLLFENEFARHKLLDSVGDIYNAGTIILGKFLCNKPGHFINNEILRKIFENPNNYEFVV
jgi:UDP-3-O-[3-hydroxymyristoyl] N-acetylglucosamine deacetylase